MTTTTGGSATSGGSATTAGGATATTGGTNGGGAADGGSTVEEGGAGGADSSGALAMGDGGNDTAGDTPPWRPLNITAPSGEHIHTIFGNSVGLDTRAAKMIGKLIVDMGVASGGYWTWAGKRGFHVFGVSFAECAVGPPPPADGACRAVEFKTITDKLTAGLPMLQQMYPTEDWGYFLNKDGTIRWSDVGFTGVSHGATTAARIGHLVRLYRAVSRSGPRDNTCGDGKIITGDYNPMVDLRYDPQCKNGYFASWLDEPVVTPIDRFFSFVGELDGQFGDDFFHAARVGYVGQPVNIGTAQAPYGGSHRFYAQVGHEGFEEFTDAMNIAWGVPLENQHPAF
jgi:hypothetical protein